jgi:hypothetical protein
MLLCMQLAPAAAAAAPAAAAAAADGGGGGCCGSGTASTSNQTMTSPQQPLRDHLMMTWWSLLPLVF